MKVYLINAHGVLVIEITVVLIALRNNSIK